MMTRGLIAVLIVGVLLVGGAVGLAQQAPAGQIRLLLVDETKTFSSTMRVGALAGALKKSRMFEVTVKLVNVETSYADPLAEESQADTPYEVMIIVPKGIDDGSIDQVWIVTRWFSDLSPVVSQGVGMASALVDKVFTGLGGAADISDDLFLGFLSALYVAEGWL